MEIVITGGSGFVGSFLIKHFLERGDRVTGLGRALKHSLANKEGFTWISADTTLPGEWQKSVSRADLVVNLAGVNIFNRWSPAYKEDIYKSRVLTTRNVVDAISDSRKTILLSTSAIGFYGNQGNEILTESSSSGDDFLAGVCRDWESAASSAIEKGSRVVIMRFAVVLGKNGGALGKMLPLFKAFLGGPLGDGNHWFPWIHIKDLARAMDFCISNGEIHGPVNLCSPGSLRQGKFAAVLGRALNRPAFMPAPSWVIRMVMGEMGDAVLASTRALPERLEQAGFKFEFADIEAALKDIIA